METNTTPSDLKVPITLSLDVDDIAVIFRLADSDDTRDKMFENQNVFREVVRQVATNALLEKVDNVMHEHDVSTFAMPARLLLRQNGATK